MATQAILNEIGMINHAGTEVCILMATFNGGLYLEKQLASFEAQTHTNWRLIVSDDGSSDATLQQLAAFQRRHGNKRVVVLEGPRAGFAQNFLSLVRRIHDAPFYAFSDQDDIWAEHHLASSISCHMSEGTFVPTVSSSRTILIDARDQVIGYSPLFKRQPTFENALLQNIGGGNTMVLNRSARDLLAQVKVDDKVVSHDWLAYMLITGVGGRFIYLASPSVLYRQHGANLVGMNNSIRARLQRCKALFRGQLGGWISSNLSVLDRFVDTFTPRNQFTYAKFKKACAELSLQRRLSSWIASGVRRQSFLEDVAIFVAVIGGRI